MIRSCWATLMLCVLSVGACAADVAEEGTQETGASNNEETDEGAPESSTTLRGEGGADGSSVSDTAAGCGDTFQTYRAALRELTETSSFYACKSNADCTEVGECNVSRPCYTGTFLNVMALDALQQEWEALNTEGCCAEVNSAEALCPEPEPPSEACVEGVCLGVIGEYENEPVTDCPSRVASLQSLLAEIHRGTRNCNAAADCVGITIGNGCTEGSCITIPVATSKERVVGAQLSSHFATNDCSECGVELDCMPAPVTCEGARCALVP